MYATTKVFIPSEVRKSPVYPLHHNTSKSPYIIGRKMNQYWLLLRPVLVTTRSSTGHYQRPVLVRSLTSTSLFYPSQEIHTSPSVRALYPNTIIPVRQQAPHGDNQYRGEANDQRSAPSVHVLVQRNRPGYDSKSICLIILYLMMHPPPCNGVKEGAIQR